MYSLFSAFFHFFHHFVCYKLFTTYVMFNALYKLTPRSPFINFTKLAALLFFLYSFPVTSAIYYSYNCYVFFVSSLRTLEEFHHSIAQDLPYFAFFLSLASFAAASVQPSPTLFYVLCFYVTADFSCFGKGLKYCHPATDISIFLFI